MNINVNPNMKEWVLERLRVEYSSPRPFPHATELIYCLTRSYYDRLDPLLPTEREMLMFSVGFGMERLLLRGAGVKPLKLDDVNLSPDFLMVNGDQGYGELKTTRQKPPPAGSAPELSEGWLKQIMCYCWATKTVSYNLAVLHIIQPELRAWELGFEVGELEENWQWMMDRKQEYVGWVGMVTPPTAFKYNMEWECGYCRYKTRCDVAKIQDRGPSIHLGK